MAHDGGACVVGHVGAGRHAGGPVACAVDGDRWKARGLQSLVPVVAFGAAAYRVAARVGEYELARADAESFDARPQSLPQAHGYGHEPVRGAGLGRGEPQDAVQVLGFEPGGYDGLFRPAVLLDLLLYVDARHAVTLFELVGHERVAFAFPHAGREREFEQQHPGFIDVHGQGRSASFRSPVGHGLDQLLRLVWREDPGLGGLHPWRLDPAARIHGDELLELGLVEHHLQAHEMVLERGGREPFGKHAHALADMVRGQLGEADTADDLHARMDPAGAGAVRGGLDVEPVFLQPPLRVILQVRALGAGQQAGAFHLGDLRVEPFAGIGLRPAGRRYEPPLAGRGVPADLAAELPSSIRAVDDAARALRAPRPSARLP